MLIKEPGENECTVDPANPDAPTAECRGHRTCQVEGDGTAYCLWKKGAGNNDCDSVGSYRDCYHSECEGASCKMFPGKGEYKCDSHEETNDCHHLGCRDGQCVDVPGEQADSCAPPVLDSSTVGSGKDCIHLGCQNGQCVVLPGEEKDNCIGCGYHLECVGDGDSAYCAPAKGDGENKCSERGAACSHRECRNNECITVPGQGRSTCSISYGGRCFHNECASSGECKRVEGEGDDECSPSVLGSCRLRSECIDDKCVISYAGAGDSSSQLTCTEDRECTGHYACTTANECVYVPGPGYSNCRRSYYDSIVVLPVPICKHYECVGATCRMVDGPGYDRCTTSPDDCGHLACQDGACKLVAGGGMDECNVSAQCKSSSSSRFSSLASSNSTSSQFSGESSSNPSSEAYTQRLDIDTGWRARFEPAREDSDNVKILSSLPERVSVGPSDAPITVVMFQDLNCGMCQYAFHENIERVRAEYGDSVRVVFRENPLGNMPQSRRLAEAALCANEQGKYLQFLRYHYSRSSKDSPDEFADYVTALNLNDATFRECVSSGRYGEAIQADFSVGERLGVKGTPAFFINGRRLEGAQDYSRFKQFIEALL